MVLPPEHVSLALDDPPFGLTREAFMTHIAVVVNDAAEQVGLPEGALAELVVADKTHFAPVIHELQRGAGRRPEFTSNAVYEAVAKTLPSSGMGEPNATQSVVILRADIAALAVASTLDEDLADEWRTKSDFCHHVIAHELGHCKDDFLRGLRTEMPRSIECVPIIRPLARFNLDLILSEFAARVHAAPTVPDHTFATMPLQWARDAMSLLAQVEDSRSAYRADPAAEGRLRRLAIDAGQATWVHCAQYAKIVGTALGDPDLPPLVAPDGAHGTSPAQGLLAKAALEQLDSTLRSLWQSYPHWLSVDEDTFIPAWQQLAFAHGYHFIEGGGGPGGDISISDDLLLVEVPGLLDVSGGGSIRLIISRRGPSTDRARATSFS